MIDGSNSDSRRSSAGKIRCSPTLRLIDQGDIIAVTGWPSYRAGYEQMDYALRENGWLEEYGKKPGTWCYMAEVNGEPVGFSLLSAAGNKEAEFRIALHPERTGQGFGKEIAAAILELGFSELGLDMIHLIVRKNNCPAISLYKKLGFRTHGECVRVILGESIEFFMMDIRKQEFQSRRRKGNGL